MALLRRLCNTVSMLNILAHAEDLHKESTSELIHLLTQWYIALPLFFTVLALILIISEEYFGFKVPQLMLLSMPILFIAGIATYAAIPALSIISLTLGIGLALFFTLVSIAG